MRTRVNAIRRTSCALLCGITAGFLGGTVAVPAAEATPTAQADGRRVIVIESGEQVVVDADEGTAIAVDVSDEPTELINEGLIRAILDGAGPEGAAVGVCASAGDDRIVNRGSLISSTTIDQSLRLGGARANGDATGVSAGAGVDEVLNTGVLDVRAESVAGSGSLDVTTSGDSTINASSTAQATARGFDGGEGDDRLENDATMTVSASGTAGAGAIDVTRGGNGAVDVSSSATAEATGFVGGAGNDELVNEGTLTVVSVANAGSGAISVSLPEGSSNRENGDEETPLSADASTSVTASAIGMDGGEGADEITNEGALVVTATVGAGSGSIGVSLTDDATASASTRAVATAVGIVGGDDDDDLANEAAMVVTAEATSGSGSVGVSVGGSSEADVSSTATAVSAGLAGGAGADDLANEGALAVIATANAGSGTISLSLPEGGGDDKSGVDTGVDTGVTKAAAASTAGAGVTGLAGGTGDDAITNALGASISLRAESDAIAIGISIEIGKPEDDLSASAAIGNARATARTRASGINGGFGNDTILNEGLIGSDPRGTEVVEAKAEAVGVAVVTDIVIKSERMVADAALVDARTVAGATAIGLSGGAGDDDMIHRGAIDMDAKATATAVSVGVTFTNVEKGVGAAAALVKAGSVATAAATGIDGGVGDDRILSSGSVRTSAESSSTAVGVAIGAGFAKKGALLEMALADSDTVAVATATGIDAGAGDDEVVNSGAIALKRVKSTADAVSVGLIVAGAKQGVAASAALADAAAISVATGIGIDGGTGDDRIINSGSIATEENVAASATAAAVTVDVGFAKQGATLGASLANGSANALAAVVGIDAGAGNDEVVNTGVIGLVSEADATGVSVALTVTGAMEGAALGASMANASANATALATGIDGGYGIDEITNDGQIAVLADSAATGVSVGVTVTGAKAGAALGAALTHAVATAEANAAGIDGGEGDDRIHNSGLIGVNATSDVTAVGVSVGFAVVKEGAALSAALSDTSAVAGATAAGIAGGAGNDEITNDVDGSMNVAAHADADAVSVSVEVGVGGVGLAAGASLADASATATAVATGISGGVGNDTITNEGAINLMYREDGSHDASASATSISVALNGTMTGAAGGAALTDASALAQAIGTGLDGGAGNDTISNTGSITGDTSASATATGVSVQIGVTGTGVAGGMALADSSAVASATTTGIDGGDGDDLIHNEGDIDVRTSAFADAFSLAISLTASLNGISMGGTVTDAGTTALATGCGITGGHGNDEIRNTGSIVTQAASTAESESISVTVSIALASGGAAVAVAKSTATASATGISGGEGDDRIENGEAEGEGSSRRFGEGSGGIAVTSTAYSSGTSIAANIAMGGLGMGETTNMSTADATGIHGDDGNDVIRNHDAITVVSGAVSEGLSLTVNLAGAGMGDATTTASATAAGICGGEGADEIENDGTINVFAAAAAESDAITPGLIGVAQADASTTALARATGIDGGEGNDRITNRASINVSAGDPVAGIAGASTDSQSTTLSLVGAGTASANSTSVASATGIQAGTGDDVVKNDGSLTVKAYSKGKSGAVDLRLAGAGNANAASTTSALVTGIDGGAGVDRIRNSGTIDALTVSDGYSKSFGLTALGAVETNAKVSTTARAAGIVAGEASDNVENSGSIRTQASAVGSSISTAVNLVGQPDARADTTTHAFAVGIDGGEGIDSILNKGRIISVSTSSAIVKSTTFTVVGVSSSEGLITATSRSEGIAGGSGADYIRNEGTIDVYATTGASSSASSVALLGGASTKSGILGSAVAVGIAGDGGDPNDDPDPDGEERAGDEIENITSINVTALSTATANGDAFTLGGDASASAFITAASQAYGIVGSRWADILHNEGSIVASATSSATAGQEASVALAGDAESRAEINSTADARGISAGGGNDVVSNQGSVQVNATAVASALSDSQAGTFSGEGDASSAGSSTATGVGLDLDDGEDELVNEGAITVSSLAEMYATGLADGSNFADGNGMADATAQARALAYGVRAGDGSTTIEHAGTILVLAETKAEGLTFADGDGAFGFGDGYASTITLTGDESPLAAGIWLGDGDHRIESSGAVTVSSSSLANSIATADGDLVTANAYATALASTAASAYGFRGGDGNSEIRSTSDIDVRANADAQARAVANPYGDPDGGGYTTTGSSATATGVGISLGDGDHLIDSSGTMTVFSTAVGISDSLADSDTVSVSAVAHAAIAGSAQAHGIRTGDGDNRIQVTGDIEVHAAVDTLVRAQSNPTGWADGGGGAEATSTIVAQAYGISTGEGKSEVTNEGLMRVTALANPTAEPASRDLVADGDGDTGRDAWATSASETTLEAVGIRSEGSVNRIVNDGDIFVTAQGSTAPWTRAGSDGPDGNATADSTATIEVSADGIRAGGEIVNHGTVGVAAHARSLSGLRADTGDWEPDGDARAVGTSEAIAYAGALHGGADADRILNEGVLDVVAEAEASMSTATTAGTFAHAAATALSGSEARAVGIQAGDGDNEVTNRGQIVVRAEAVSKANAWAEDDGGAGSSERATAMATASAEAWGIQTGCGSDTVVNEGSIDVTSYVEALAWRDTEDGSAGYGAMMAKTYAVGIESGDGDDTIVNAGTITAIAIMNFAGQQDEWLGMAIDAGAGDDVVLLADGSVTRGHIDLGEGDDLLTFQGNAALRGFDGPATDVFLAGRGGVDTLVLEDVDTLALYNVSGFEGMQLNDGTLEIHGDHQMAADGWVQVLVNGENRSGQLKIVGGQLGLAGRFEIEAAPSAYHDGQAFDVLVTDGEYGMSGALDECLLPEPTAFLDFNMELLRGGIRVDVDVQPFLSAAATSVEQSMAGALDAMATTATGDLSHVIGSFQLAGARQVPLAFSSLSPAAYDNFTRAAIEANRQYGTGIRYRLDNARIVGRNHPAGAGHGLGVWVNGLGSWGKQDSGDGFAGHDYGLGGVTVGVDTVGARTQIGGALGYGSSDVELDANLGESEIDSVLASLYGGWWSRRAYIQWALSFTNNRFSSRRNLWIGDLRREAHSEHDAYAYSGFVSGGYGFPVQEWLLEPFGLLGHIRLNEPTIHESGAGAANLIVGPRKTDVLRSQLGLRVQGEFAGTSGMLYPEFTVAWVHDLRNDDRTLTAALEGDPGTQFSFEGQDLVSNGVALSAGFGFQGQSHWSASLRLNSNLNSDSRSFGMFGEFRWAF